VHPCPEKAVSDGAQSLTLPGFRQLMRDLQPYIRLWNESRLSRMAPVAAATVAV
jgi:3-deoxy-7-phosphoheptulonate synthase